MANEHDANAVMYAAAVDGWRVGTTFDHPAPVRKHARRGLLARVLALFL